MENKRRRKVIFAIASSFWFAWLKNKRNDESATASHERQELIRDVIRNAVSSDATELLGLNLFIPTIVSNVSFEPNFLVK